MAHQGQNKGLDLLVTWVQVDAEMSRGALPGLLSIAAKLGPATQRVVARTRESLQNFEWKVRSRVYVYSAMACRHGAAHEAGRCVLMSFYIDYDEYGIIHNKGVPTCTKAILCPNACML